MTDAFNVLRRFAQKSADVEQCEMCSQRLAPDHQHLIEPESRRLLCVCDACAVLFPSTQARYRRVPREVQFLTDVEITDAQWDSLLIPIDMAFFYNSTPAKRVVAVYPSPAGPTESLLSLETWQDVVRDNPVLARLEPDVEALVVNRIGPGRSHDASSDRRAEYYLLPIDECFKLVGLIRLHWKGLSGGVEVWGEVQRYFDGVRTRANGTRQVLHA